MALDPNGVERQGAQLIRILSAVADDLGDTKTLENQLVITYSTPSEYVYRLEERGSGGNETGIVTVEV